MPPTTSTTNPIPLGVSQQRMWENTFDDYSAGRQFPDQVAVYNRPADVHSTNASKEEYERFMQDMHGTGKLARVTQWDQLIAARIDKAYAGGNRAPRSGIDDAADYRLS